MPTTRACRSIKARQSYFSDSMDPEELPTEDNSSYGPFSPSQTVFVSVGRGNRSFVRTKLPATNGPNPSLPAVELSPTMSEFKNSTASTSDQLETSVPNIFNINLEKDSLARQTFPFQDLPPEIRNNIYRRALTNNTPIEITNERLEFRSGISQQLKTRVGRARVDDSLAVLLLTANHSIRKEAIGMLYGANRFLFSDFKVLEQFLQLIGSDNRKHLSNITINGEFHKLEARSAGSMLIDAKYLKNIHFGPWKCKHDTFVNNVWECLRPLFVAVYRANKKFDAAVDFASFESWIDPASVGKAIKVISFERETCYLDTSSAETATRAPRSNAKANKGNSKTKEAPKDTWLKTHREMAQTQWKNKLANYLAAPNYIKNKGDILPGYPY